MTEENFDAHVVQDELETQTQGVNTELIRNGEQALIDIQVVTAHRYPRNISAATRKLVAFVTDKDNKRFAESCQYAVPRGGKAIVGPSVHLAKLCAQHFGNLRIAAKVIDVGGTHITSQGVCWDLENNVAVSTEVMRSITSAEKIQGRPTGKRIKYSDDMVVVTGNAANSIALRNAILSVIPKGLVETVYRAAQNAILGNITTEDQLTAKQIKIVTRFKEDYGVEESAVLKVVGKANIKFLSKDDLQVLIGIGTAIADGDTTVEESFYGEGKTVIQQKNKMSETLKKTVENEEGKTDSESRTGLNQREGEQQPPMPGAAGDYGSSDGGLFGKTS